MMQETKIFPRLKRDEPAMEANRKRWRCEARVADIVGLSQTMERISEKRPLTCEEFEKYRSSVMRYLDELNTAVKGVG